MKDYLISLLLFLFLLIFNYYIILKNFSHNTILTENIIEVNSIY